MIRTAEQSKLAYQRLLESRRIDAPYCQCGCGQKTNWLIRTKSYGKYLFNHQLPDLSGSWTPRIEEIVRGTALGDGHLDPRRGRKGVLTGLARLSLRHSTKRQLEYAKYLHEELKPITTSKLRVRKTEESYGKEIAEFSTVSLPQLFEIWKEIYREDGTKFVTLDYLNKLSDFAFTIWWSDDGSSNSLSTHSFTQDENELIVDWLRLKYGCITKVDFDKRVSLPYIKCNADAMRIISKIVFPYLEKSLWYKLARFLPDLLKDVSLVSNHIP